MQIGDVVEVNVKMRITKMEQFPYQIWVSGHVLNPDGTDLKGGSGAFVPADTVTEVLPHEKAV